MKFWSKSGMEEEYNEMNGKTKDGEHSEESSPEKRFGNLMSDIKTDLKKIPREDVWPAYSAGDKADEDEEALETPLKKRGDKTCKINGNTYEVGETWKDPNTGKDMICILMSVPKDLQTKLAEEKNIITVEESPEQNIHSSGPQWAYTAYPKKKIMVKSEKERCPDKEDDKLENNQPDVVDKTTNVDQSESIVNTPKSPQDLPEKVEEPSEAKEVQSETPESNPEVQESTEQALEQHDRASKEGKGVAVDSPEEKKRKDSQDESFSDTESDGKEYERIQSSRTTTKQPEKTKDETDVKSEVTKPAIISPHPAQKHNETDVENIPDKSEQAFSSDSDESEDDAEQADQRDKSEPESKEAEELKPATQVQADQRDKAEPESKEAEALKPATQVQDDQRDKSEPESKEAEELKPATQVQADQRDKAEPESKEVEELKPATQANVEIINPKTPHIVQPPLPDVQDKPAEVSPKTEEDPETQQKGQPIYTKETVVTHKKLFKTEETTETIETDKTGQHN